LTVYLDTSVLVSLLHEDNHTNRVLDWAGGVDAIVLSAWTATEFTSALSVQSRMRRLIDRDRRRLELDLDHWLSTRVVLDVLNADIVAARRLVRNDVRLRAPDGVHLALVMRHGCVLATLDEDMAAVARDIGLSVIVP
jgi:predicted nucleic acid-binding protein